ncbi:RICIN domain-containing protein [Phaeobacter sp. HF9A]|uniref:RICIN domain-containing protein n=1 Tax=Phaeobacter sp. HF9A TaxID=2721561 RepID=UPI0014304F6E|nr:ricin-type beta-trefoil lectin domain protein [Phaeobacter sp. HF9A]NIZ15589.1 ricin-type beta-trefoil lectin domain protein [Phaeobacter sp. HF9A]
MIAFPRLCQHSAIAICALAFSTQAPLAQADTSSPTGVMVINASDDSTRVCLGVQSSPPGPGTAVVGVACDGDAPLWHVSEQTSTPQRIVFGTPGQQEQCLDVDTAHPSKGTLVQVWNCAGSSDTNQLFTWSGQGALQLASNQWCVDSGLTLGAQASISPCGATSDVTLFAPVPIDLGPFDSGSSTGHLAVFIQGSQTSGFTQRLSLFGDALNYVQTDSAGGAAGSQYALSHVSIDTSEGVPPRLTYFGNVEYDINGTWTRSPVVVATQQMAVAANGLATMLASNDGGSDQDNNDTTVLFSVWRNTTD